jgi:hypothetical protein
MPAHCPPGCSDGALAKDAAAFNTHSQGGGGSGLAQHVFRSPARIPATGSRTARSMRRAAKRKTLYIIRTFELCAVRRAGLANTKRAAY